MIQPFFKIFKIDFDKNRIYGLDILRALAILFVVFGHSKDLLPASIDKRIFSILPFVDGVAVFFVLSGFLIGGILIKILENEKHSFKTLLTFWKRRWLRTLPAYYFILIVLIVLSVLLTKNFNVFGALNYFIFFQNFKSPHPGFFVEAWSLSIEEWFYLLIPLLIFSSIFLLKIQPQKANIIIISVVITFTIFIRYFRYVTINVISEKIWDEMFRGQVVTRLDNLTFGVFGAYMAYYYKTFWIKYKNLFFYFGLIFIILLKLLSNLLLPTSVFYFCNFSFLLTETAILMLLPFLSLIKSGTGFIYKCITYTSLISYSMYLTHASLMLHWIVTGIWYVNPFNIKLIVIRYILYWIATFLLSILLYKYLERPFMNYRNKLK